MPKAQTLPTWRRACLAFAPRGSSPTEAHASLCAAHGSKQLMRVWWGRRASLTPRRATPGRTLGAGSHRAGDRQGRGCSRAGPRLTAGGEHRQGCGPSEPRPARVTPSTFSTGQPSHSVTHQVLQTWHNLAVTPRPWPRRRKGGSRFTRLHLNLSS